MFSKMITGNLHDKVQCAALRREKKRDVAEPVRIALAAVYSYLSHNEIPFWALAGLRSSSSGSEFGSDIFNNSLSSLLSTVLK